MLEPLPPAFGATREALHALAEHVLAPARYRFDGHIGLVPSAGGFGTPTFDDGQRVRVEGVELVHERPGSTRRVPITTLSDAAQFVGVPLGAPTEVYKPATACVPDIALAIEVDAARALAVWIDFAAGLLHELRESYAGQSPSAVQLWPEHFDLACDLGDRDAGTRANYGASPGDSVLAEPYLYVGPWDAGRRTGVFAMYPFGAGLTYEELRTALESRAAGRDFLRDGASLLVGAP
jgi:hypothetical protein